MKKGHHMSMSRKLEIVRAVLNKSKGVTMLHGDKLIQHVASSITLYEKYIPDEKNTKEVGSL